MSYEFYKILHLLGLVLLVFGLFGFGSVLWNGQEAKPHLRKLWVISHGVGLVFLLVAGFGLLARLGLTSGIPHWVYAKLVLWLGLGLLLSLVKRRPQKMALWLSLVFLFVLGAIILAVTKPF